MGKYNNLHFGASINPYRIDALERLKEASDNIALLVKWLPNNHMIDPADERPDGPLAPDALLRAGDAYAELWRRPELDPTYGETARGVYQEVVSRYGGTPAAARATLRLTALTEKFAVKEYRSALFYFRFKAYDSAILMLRGVVATYPKSRVVPDALEHLVRAYQILGYQEDVKETCAYIVQYHPEPAGPRRIVARAMLAQRVIAVDGCCRLGPAPSFIGFHLVRSCSTGRLWSRNSDCGRFVVKSCAHR